MPQPAKVTRKKKVTDPTGRVDILVIGLLERAVQLHGDIPLRGIYGTYKPEIDRAIRKHLGKVRFYFGPAKIGGLHAR